MPSCANVPKKKFETFDMLARSQFCFQKMGIQTNQVPKKSDY